ncbi:MAG: hypothetical protein AAFX99_09915 [Myxococcota bacterium]
MSQAMVTTATTSSHALAQRSELTWDTLMAMDPTELEAVFVRGLQPDLDQLIGWEFRGTNHPAWASAVGIRKFIKGFWRTRDGLAKGYNCPVVQDGLTKPWRARPLDHDPKRFGFYRVDPVDAASRDNAYLHALLLDYGRGGNPWFDPSAGLRDYLVQVAPHNPDLLLGKAYYALGPARVPTNFFILQRHRKGPSYLV